MDIFVADFRPPVAIRALFDGSHAANFAAQPWDMQISNCPRIVPNSLPGKSAAIRKAPQTIDLRGFNNGGRGRNRTGVGGFAIRSITTLLLGLKTPCYTSQSVKTWSGKRDSNSRPRPWQGRALPTELFPHRVDGRHSI
jgi:hypothetical protein